MVFFMASAHTMNFDTIKSRYKPMLSDVQVRKAKPEAKSYKMSDARQLYLVINPNRGKLWRLNYGFGGKQKTLSLGVYPDVSLSDARVRRDEAKKLLAHRPRRAT
jgi:hypothetical protein